MTHESRKRNRVMYLPPEKPPSLGDPHDEISGKMLAAQLQLTDDQMNKMRKMLTEAHDSLAQYLLSNPNVSNAEVVRQLAIRRDQLRKQLGGLLTPQQLKAW